jgi:DNA-3-methyladenine glycosylase
MLARRGVARDEDLCSGPGKLTQALGVELWVNGLSLVDGPVRILAGAPRAYVTGPRVGITKAAELPWRFCALGSRSVSRPWPPGLRESLAASR